MPPTWIVAALYALILGALALIVRWEYQRVKKRQASGQQPEKELNSRL